MSYTHKELTELELVKFMNENEGKIKTVLEIGCGTGHFRKFFDDKNISWIGIDINATGPSVLFGDFNNIPFLDNTFDLVLSCHSFEHTLDPIRTLREIKRVSQQFIWLSTPYPCKHQILDADEDHLFCLTDLQMERLMRWVNITPVKIYYDKKAEKEQDYNLISVGCINDNEK